MSLVSGVGTDLLKTKFCSFFGRKGVREHLYLDKKDRRESKVCMIHDLYDLSSMLGGCCGHAIGTL